MDYSMNFELSMMQFFGDKAHHIASYARNESEVKSWLKKAIKKMMKDVLDIVLDFHYFPH